MKHFLALVLTLGATSQAHASDTCARWVNNIDPCDGIVAQGVCNYPSQWTPNQWINYKNWNYSDSAEDACKKYVLKEDPIADVCPLRFVDSSTYACFWDSDGDGCDEDDFDTNRILVTLEEIQKDACCRLVPNSPYGRVPNDPTIAAGGEFSSDHRKRILAKGLQYTPDTSVKTDAARIGMVDGGADLLGMLRIRPATLGANDDPEFTPITRTIDPNVTSGDIAHIDHVIPRIDSNGCPCGSNTSANAAIISGQLNTSMGRSCLDPRRMEFLQAWTLPPPQGLTTAEETPTSSDDAVVDPFTRAEAAVATTGGCSTSAGGGVGGLIVLLGGLFGMRRTRRAARN